MGFLFLKKFVCAVHSGTFQINQENNKNIIDNKFEIRYNIIVSDVIAWIIFFIQFVHKGVYEIIWNTQKIKRNAGYL